VTRDYEQALLYAENTARASPNDATSHAFVASALEGLGRNAEALAAYERALALDPMNVGLHSNRLELLVALRRPDGFEAACAKWREVQPEVSATLFFPGRFRLYGEIPKELVGLRVYDTALWLWRTRRFADLISLLDAELARGDMAVRMRFDVLEKKAQALRRTDRFNDLQTVAQEMSGIAGQLLDDDDAEYAHDSSRVAKAKALNGEVDAAVSTLRRAIATTSAAKQMWRARVQRTHLAEILAAAGRAKECVALLAEILAAGSPTLSVLSLRLDPTWDSVREDAAFKALLADPKNSAPL
jgi:tetratricopeptide (TPR) repeat protein